MMVVGWEFFECCVLGLEDIEYVSVSFIESQGELFGSLCVVVLVDFFDNFFIEWMYEFMYFYFKVQLEFVFNDGCVDLIVEGIDLVFWGGVLFDFSLVVRKLVQSYMVFIVSLCYLECVGMLQVLVDLVGYVCLVMLQVFQYMVWKLEGLYGLENVWVVLCLCINIV